MDVLFLILRDELGSLLPHVSLPRVSPDRIPEGGPRVLPKWYVDAYLLTLLNGQNRFIAFGKSVEDSRHRAFPSI
jgi:hypothetical protein